ncbi:MAG: DNA cytosine methyltransferase [Dyella sp.]|nr:DNA cytosine methyltransferase [Dyella sp.]
MTAYYNELDPFAAQWLRNLIDAGHIAFGHVDTRSIEDVTPADLAGFTQCHFFAGIGGWSLALRLAGWPDDRSVWTGSCPCQPFSVAGKGAGFADERHLWPAWFHLISQCRPAVVFGEQVAAAIGHQWLDGVCADLEGQDYGIGAAVLPACAVGAPHRRDRLWFVADTNTSKRWSIDQMRGRVAGKHAVFSGKEAANRSCAIGEDVTRALANTNGKRFEGISAGRETDRTCADGARREATGGSGARNVANADSITGRQGSEVDGGRDQGGGQESWAGLGGSDSCSTLANADESCASEGWEQRSWEQHGPSRDPWARHSWIIGHDGKARRVEPSIRLLAHGLPGRVGRLRAYGNAIVPQVAAEFIQAYCESREIG